MSEMNERSACTCGRYHPEPQCTLIIQKDAIACLPRLLLERGTRKVFLLADSNTHRAAGVRTEAVLAEAGIPYTRYVFSEAHVFPDEASLGRVMMYFDPACDTVVGVGSGVINDIGKALSVAAGKTYAIVATAPSMDGYASASSSMEREGLKVSIPTQCPDVIVGDVDVLKAAPERMLAAGLGDMLAKYVSICEWRLSHVITGEYYCEEIAKDVRAALQKCVENAKGLLAREEDAVAAVFEGLVLSGFAMNRAGISRPASGCEHYLSHVWDMRALEFGTPCELHGIQCAVGTLMVVRAYELLKMHTPNRAHALAFAENFDRDAWFAKLRAFIGKGAEAMIAQDEKERKYDREKHAEHLARILSHWEELMGILEEELPTSEALLDVLRAVKLPERAEAFGIDPHTHPLTLQATKDIRDKYVLSRLAWDLGILEPLSEALTRF